MSFLFMELPWAMESRQTASSLSLDDYGLYDQIVEDKFLTSQIQLVLLERLTISRLVPNRDESMTMTFFQQQGYFEGMLPRDLVRDFVGANRDPARLEGRFRFGARYRFMSGETSEDVEARLAVSAMTGHRMVVQVPSVLDRLAFSKVGRTLQNDQALVYVENRRRDGTGAGFLVWFHRREREWAIFDTEVVWTIRNEEARPNRPRLAP